MKLTDEHVRMLAECERMMDNGEMPYVRLNGERVSATMEAMDHFGLTVGQTINGAIFVALCRYNIASLEEKIAAKVTGDMMEKLTKKRE